MKNAINAADAPVTGAFPTQTFLRDFRAAGGWAGIVPARADDSFVGQVFFNFDIAAASDMVHSSYAGHMRADPDHRAKIKAALEAEVIALAPAELAVLHAY
jgi:hypothetical protein